MYSINLTIQVPTVEHPDRWTVFKLAKLKPQKLFKEIIEINYEDPVEEEVDPKENLKFLYKEGEREESKD